MRRRMPPSFHLECLGMEDEPTEDQWFCEKCTLRRKHPNEAKYLYDPKKFSSNLATPGSHHGQTAKKAASNFVRNAPSNPPFRKKNQVQQQAFYSELLEQQAERSKASKQVTHLRMGMTTQEKQQRRKIEDFLLNKHAYYDPIWCCWRPQTKEEYIPHLNRLSKELSKKAQAEAEDQDIDVVSVQDEA
eukprot:TRINITY_DN4934_c0_g1_i1.p2 TRINITY_DN4934_c0_g1~~TRINITY_DN4934_c0_g1_i1.p2  ORF type:complete len:188 (-),score=55.40 TRINITY_DN4934_c0_g1_i1:27-590(-)